MNLAPPPPMGVTLRNVLDPVIINSQKTGYRVFLLGKVLDASGKELAEYRTNFFNIQPGVTHVNYNDIGLVYQNYMDLEFQGSFERMHYFPIGYFELCATLVQDESSKVLAETCVPTHVLPLQPPRLVFPLDTATVKTPYPIFSWLPVTGPGASQSSIRYEIAIKEIFPGQSPAEAITSNPDVLIADNLSSTFLPYPSTALNQLTEGDKYAWQVKAYSGDYFLGQSEIWAFKLSKDSIKIKVVDSAFAIVKRNLDGGCYNATQYLFFEYQGEYTSQNLNLKIYTESMVEIHLPKRAKLWQNRGPNKYSLDLRDVKGIKNNDIYILEINNEKNVKYYLRFKYKSQDKN